MIPMARWDRIAEKAMRFGLLMSKDLKIVHVHSEDEHAGLEDDWDEKIKAPIEKEGLQVAGAGHDSIVVPVHHQSADGLHPGAWSRSNPGRKVAVLLPELVVRHWWENALHNQRVQLLKLLLLVKGNQRIVVVNIPWYL